MNLEELNNVSAETLANELEKCCGSHHWVEKMISRRPFPNKEELFRTAEDVWFALDHEDWLEAFGHHPKIGDVNSLAKKFANTKQWAEGEQSGVKQATEDVIAELAAGNQEYEAKFGFIFIVCATGKSAQEMLDLLKDRLDNDPGQEIIIAAGEQDKITKIRLEKLLG